VYLTADSLVPYLLQRGILKPRDLLQEHWFVADNDMKRPVLRVSTPAGGGWIVKQASPLDATHVRMLDREAALFYLPRLQDWARPLRSLMPRMRSYDPGVHALVVDELPHDTAWDHLRRRTAQPAKLGALLGQALGRAHQVVIPPAAAQPMLFAAKLPWILQLNRTGLDEIDEPATRALLALIRSDDGLCRRLLALEENWRTDTLVHGDAKLDNALVRVLPRPRVWLIDWAFAGRGDPAWDVGSMIQSCLQLWLYGITFRRDAPFADAVDRSAFPIHIVQDFSRTLLETYRKERALTDHAARGLILKAARFSGAALLQSALADSRTEDQYTMRQLAMLQVGMHILAHPRQSMTQFFDAR
jgi:aminoglycoside phosphotransferase (APT) family kinase protein